MRAAARATNGQQGEAQDGAREDAEKTAIGDAWMAWTENPADPQGLQLDKFKTDAVAALQAGGKALRDAGAIAPHLAAVRDGVDHVLGFFGLKGERVRHARDAILELTGGK